jgi:MFS family permease
MLLLGAWAGALSDRFNRRRITLVTQSLMALQAIVLGICDVTGNINVPIVFALTGMLGLVGAIDNPARRALVTELVPEADMSNAMSLNTAVMTGSRIFGPAIASALVGPLGTGWLFVLNGISFAAMLFGVAGLRTAQMYSPAPRPAGGTPVRDGLRFVAHNDRLRVLFIVFTIVSTFAFNYSVSLPKLSDIKWGDPKYFGWVLAVTSMGSLFGALLTARLAKATYRWVAVNTLVLGVANIGMAWSPNVWVAFVWAIPLGKLDHSTRISARYARSFTSANGSCVSGEHPYWWPNYRVHRRLHKRAVVTCLRRIYLVGCWCVHDDVDVEKGD